MTRNTTTNDRGKERILIIEDNKALREGLKLNLKAEDREVLTAADGEEGMKMAFDKRPDLIVLDIILPRQSGLDILEELRRRGERTPVLILSARDRTRDKVEGLDLGADDYLTKPFDLPELIARIEAMLRRQRSEEHDRPTLFFGDIIINQSARSVTVRGREVELSAKEFDFLCLLAESPGKVFTRDTILERIWGWDYEGTARTIDNFVATLRKKIESGRRAPKHIKTVPRVGYKFMPGVLFAFCVFSAF